MSQPARSKLNGPILALGTSGPWCEVALATPEPGLRILAERRVVGHAHSTHLIPMVAAMLRRAGCGFDDLAGLAYEAGPGGFTGLRVACGVAQGIALAFGAAVCAVDSLAAVALAAVAREERRSRPATEPVDVFVAVDARMRQCYFGHYRIETGAVRSPASPPFQFALHVVHGAAVGPPSEVVAALARLRPASRPLLLAGDAFRRYPELAPTNVAGGVRPLAEARATAHSLLRFAIACGDWTPAVQARLNYVRDKVALDVDEQRELRAAGGAR